MKLTILLFIRFIANSKIFEKDGLTEHLMIRPLSTEKMVNHFKFKVSSSLLKNQSTHFMMAKPLRIFLDEFQIKDIIIHFTKGVWESSFGVNPKPSPNGLHITATFDRGSTDIDEKWRKLLNSLSGNFCSSFSAINKQHRTFVPFTKNVEAEENTRTGELPNEAFCIENLNALFKFLPCRNKSGLAALLSFKKIFDAHYITAQIELKRFCAKNECDYSLILDLIVVQEVKKAEEEGKIRLAQLAKLLGKHADVCPLASATQVAFDVLPNIELIHFFENQNIKFSQEVWNKDSTLIIVDINKNNWAHLSYGVSEKKTDLNSIASIDRIPFDKVKFSQNGREFDKIQIEPVFLMFLSRTAPHLEQVTISLSNKSLDGETLITASFPWFVKLHFHSLIFELNGVILRPSDLLRFDYTPAVPRSTSHVIALRHYLPSNSSFSINFEFQKPLLRNEDFPCDRFRGFDFASASAIFLRTNTQRPQNTLFESVLKKTYSNQVLLFLPSPDNTMPFKVIMYASLIVSLFILKVFYIVYGGTQYFEERKPFIVKVADGAFELLKYLYAKLSRKFK